MSQNIGLIAGNGKLPLFLAKSIRAQGYRLMAIAFYEETRKDLENYVDSIHWVNIGELGKIIDLLLKEKVKKAVLIGGVPKTHFFSRAKPDWRALKVLIRLPHRQDDTILRAVAEEMESEGIKIISPLPFLTDYIAPPGVWTNRQPTERERRDLIFGQKVARRIGRLDLGQTIVVKNEMVLAVEAMEGTDQAIRRGAKLGRGDVMVIKMAKPHQDMRLDLPVVGLTTIKTLIKAGATAMAMQAGKTIVMEKNKVIRQANENNICLVGI